jgi:hypothetical protein
MMLYQVVKLFGAWGMEVYYREEDIMKVSRNKCMVGWGWGWAWAWSWSRAAVEIGNFRKRRGVTVEMCNFGKCVVPCRLVICKTGGCYRGDR